ncbi:MAG: MFS family permease [Paraglaciecola psychrophila]|jgi:MFS family permease
MEKILHRNIIRIYLMTFLQSAMIITAVFVPLLQRHGLSMSEVLQTQALFAAVIVICEVPSGYLADLWGRKNVIICGALVGFMAFAFLIQASSFNEFLFYELLMGVAVSLCSGADMALVYDTQNALNSCSKKHNKDSGKHIARLTTLEGLGSGCAALGASALSYWSLDWILMVQALISFLVLLCALTLVEAPRQLSLSSHRDNASQVKQAITKDPLVLWTVLAIVALSLSALLSFWMFQKYWQVQQVPIEWFGYLWAILSVVRSISAHYAAAVEKMLGANRLILLVATLPIVGFVGMATFEGLLGLAFCLVFPLGRGLSLVMFYRALNKRLSADFRATVNSLVSLLIRAIFIVMGPMAGFFVDYSGVNFALAMLAVVFIPVYALVLIPLSRNINRQNRVKNAPSPIVGQASS